MNRCKDTLRRDPSYCTVLYFAEYGFWSSPATVHVEVNFYHSGFRNGSTIFQLNSVPHCVHLLIRYKMQDTLPDYKYCSSWYTATADYRAGSTESHCQLYCVGLTSHAALPTITVIDMRNQQHALTKRENHQYSLIAANFVTQVT